jgi:hypothetical protein
MKMAMGVIIIIVLLTLIGCSKSSMNEKMTDKLSKEMIKYSEFENGSYKIDSIIRDFESGKFFELLLQKDNDTATKHLIFDAQTGDFDHTNYIAKIPDNQYLINYDKDGELTITNRANQLIFQTNVVTKGGFSGFKDLDKSRIEFEWSNTGRYLLVDEVKTDEYFLIDLDKKRIIKIPLNGVISLKWSVDDQYAIISTGTVNKLTYYIWDIKTNNLENIGETKDFYYWSPDSKFIFLVGNITSSTDPEDVKHSYLYGVSRYDIQNKKWETVYKTEHSIQGSFKVLNGNQFIYTSNDTNKNIKQQLLRPRINHVTKYDIALKKETIKELDSFLPDQYIWSYDNKYIYYQDYHGFFKAKVDF